jgi:hypothetical protein
LNLTRARGGGGRTTSNGRSEAVRGRRIPSHEPCSKVKSHLGSHLLSPETRLYTQHTKRHPGVASSNAVGEVTDIKVKKRGPNFRGSIFWPQVSILKNRTSRYPFWKTGLPGIYFRNPCFRSPKFEFQTPNPITPLQESHRPKTDVQVSKLVPDVLNRDQGRFILGGMDRSNSKRS